MDQINIDYTKFYTRITPWLIGVAVGYLICGIQAKQIKVKLSAVSKLFHFVLGNTSDIFLYYSTDDLVYFSGKWYAVGYHARAFLLDVSMELCHFKIQSSNLTSLPFKLRST